MAASVGIRELRQHLSRYIERVKQGEDLVVTERGREVARLIPSGVPDDAVARLAAERGGSMPQVDLAAETAAVTPAPSPGSPALSRALDALRVDRA
jgi:prevent-host-death family protein